MAELSRLSVQDIRFWRVSLLAREVRLWDMHQLYISIVPNPLGVVAVLSAFNFPVAVYGW